jgi:hypothetical protein
MVTIKILCAILEFAVHSLVQVFKNGDSGRFGVFEMCVSTSSINMVRLCVPKPSTFGIARWSRALFSISQAFHILI